MPVRAGHGASARRRGAPKGNRNAVKHGFYSRALDRADRALVEEIAGCEGLDDEIAILRLKIRRLIELQPDNIELQMTAINTLARLLTTRYRLNAEQKSSLRDAMYKVLSEVAIPLGLKFIPGPLR